MRGSSISKLSTPIKLKATSPQWNYSRLGRIVGVAEKSWGLVGFCSVPKGCQFPPYKNCAKRKETMEGSRVTTFALKWHLLRVPQEYVSKTSHIQHKIVDVG